VPRTSLPSAYGNFETVLISDRDIRAEIDSQRIVLEPFDPAMVQPSSVDVRIDKFFRLFDNHKYAHIDPAEDQPELTRLVGRQIHHALEGAGVPADSVRERVMTRAQLRDRPVVLRNHEASLDADSLEPRTRRISTYLLQEYFVPERHFTVFARQLQRVLAAHDTDVLNVSIRHAPADRDTLLAWAPEDVFSFVLYHKQRGTRGAVPAPPSRWPRPQPGGTDARGGPPLANTRSAP